MSHDERNLKKFRKDTPGYTACRVRHPDWYKNPALSKAQVREAINQDGMKIFNFITDQTPEVVCLKVYGALDMVIKGRRGTLAQRAWKHVKKLFKK